jgi:hypothetical protein
MLSPTDLTVPTGLRDTAVYLRIVDDTVCEWLNETIDLTLTARTPGVVVTSGFYRFTILPSDTTCPKPVLMVYSATGPTPIENAVMDTARQMGHQVVGMREDQVGSLSYAPYSVVVVSGQVRTAGIGDILRSAAVPVLTASLANAYSLGLTLTSQLDTGRAIASSVDVNISDPVLPTGVLQGNVRIAENLSLIPWAHPAAGAVVLGRIPSIGGVIQSLPEGAPPVGRDTSMAAIYRFETGSNLSNTARRCAFPMCSATNGTAGEPVYTQGWWDLLKYCIWWTATGAIR